MDKPIRFKFKELSADNRPIGTFSKKGAFDGQQLVLGKTTVPVGAVYRVQKVLHNRLVLAFAGQSGVDTYPFLVTAGSRDHLARVLNVAVSANIAELHRRQLAASQRGGSFRAEECPFCGATIDLSDMPVTPQTYCLYCDTVYTRRDDRPREENRYRLCQRCGLYAQPQVFTSFYFYFFLVVWGYRQRTEALCHACMRNEAWKMLGANLLFLLGLPTAIYQLVRSYFGGSARSAAFAGLDGANALVHRGRFEAAVAAYEAVAGRQAACAGVRHNQALALCRLANWSEAARYLEHALRDCSNHAPSYALLLACYERLGRPSEAQALRVRWEGADSAPVPTEEEAGSSAGPL